MNISLIGMSGAGKSTIGRELAKALDLLYLDIDQALEVDFGRALPEIIRDIGEDGFVRAERDAVIAQSEGRDGLLISTGGSIVYSDEAMQHLRSISTVVYLYVPRATLVRRIEGDANRAGRIIGLAGKSVGTLIDERVPLYEKYAHARVDVGGITTREAVAAVKEQVC